MGGRGGAGHLFAPGRSCPTLWGSASLSVLFGLIGCTVADKREHAKRNRLGSRAGRADSGRRARRRSLGDLGRGTGNRLLSRMQRAVDTSAQLVFPASSRPARDKGAVCEPVLRAIVELGRARAFVRRPLICACSSALAVAAMGTLEGPIFLFHKFGEGHAIDAEMFADIRDLDGFGPYNFGSHDDSFSQAARAITKGSATFPPRNSFFCSMFC